MLGVHTLVAEDAADLVHALHTADNQALQVQLGRDAHIHVDIKGIVVRDERARVRAARDGAQDRRLDLHKADGVEVAAQVGDKLRADLEVALGLGVDDEVNIALAVACFLVGQAVVLLRQWAQRLREQRDRLRAHAHLAALGAEHLTVDADNIADVVLLEAVVLLFIHLVLASVELDAAGLVLQIAEADLAHAALAHQAARDADLAALKCVEVVLDVLGVMRHIKLGFLEGIAALGAKRCELVAAHLEDLAQVLLDSRGVLVSFFSHGVFTPTLYQYSLAFDLDNAVNDGADGGVHADLVSLFCAHERLAEGGILGDGVMHGVCLLRADDLVLGHLAAGLYVCDRHAAADADSVGACVALVDDDGVQQDILDLSDAGVQLALLVLRFIIFAVFAQVAEAARLLDKIRHFLFTHGFEVGKLVLQLFLALRAHLVLFFHIEIVPFFRADGKCAARTRIPF